jgi:TATA-box binding protein (TBP) (component of TFIID and TFIIIB)
MICPNSNYCKRSPALIWDSGKAVIKLTNDDVRCDQNVIQYNIKSASGKISNTANIVIKIVNCICKIPMDFVVLLDG